VFDVDHHYSKRNETKRRLDVHKKGRCGVVLIYTVAIAATYASKSHCSGFLEIEKHGM
jgi:ATP-dependent Clp protease adapter protein ClpS